ncbi:hypothetical protein [Stappia sp. MMSF_3263]|uniref:hypothetical protein n=1 Tax=Stappia sp. MMSF_3263 TaxID=3046693 RepID=UPI002740024A|nr:hypothetical protein [Stappia sp. MMSF_3263]
MYLALRKSLESFLSGFSILHEGAYQGWIADEKHPGYLIRVDPPAVVRAPYHIVPAFPSERELDAIWLLSRKVRTLRDSIVCLSGSAAVIKSSVTNGDFDFCEYVSSDHADIFNSLTNKFRNEDDLYFEKLYFDGRIWGAEDDFSDIECALNGIDPSISNTSFGKIDFFGKVKGFRPCDVSNVMIFCDDDWRSAAMDKTFAAQEVHMVPTLAVPNELADPYEIGRYIHWLLGQARIYFEDQNYVKALKRCLSLSRVCFLGDLSDKITNFIINSCDFKMREIEEIKIIVERISSSKFEKSHLWREELFDANRELNFHISRLSSRLDDVSISIFSQGVIDELVRHVSGREVAA